MQAKRRNEPLAASRRLARPRSGLTLVELLVVLTILVLLVSSAIPVVAPSGDERRLREASRGVNTFLAGAQARAIQSGRPFGVMLKKLSQETGSEADNGTCVEMLYVEQPAPYAGFDENSRVILGTDGAGGVFNGNQVLMRFVRLGNEEPQNVDGLRPGLDPDLIPFGLIRRGDEAEIAGHRFTLIDNATAAGDVDAQGFYTPTIGVPDASLFIAPTNGSLPGLAFVYDDVGNRLINPATQPQRFWTEPLRYQITRQPIPTSAPPYQLPEGMVIDLRASGADDTVFYRDERPVDTSQTLENVISNPTPVMIMFSPEGAVDEVIVNVGQPPNDDVDGPDENTVDNDDIIVAEPATSNVFLLVGLAENVPALLSEAEATVFAGFTGTDAELEEAKAKINWLNGQTRWVTIGAQTGTVATSENAFVNPVAIARNANFPTLAQRRNEEIRQSREFALQKSSLGGK